jgi:hypothetical protein
MPIAVDLRLSKLLKDPSERLDRPDFLLARLREPGSTAAPRSRSRSIPGCLREQRGGPFDLGAAAPPSALSGTSSRLRKPRIRTLWPSLAPARRAMNCAKGEIRCLTASASTRLAHLDQRARPRRKASLSSGTGGSRTILVFQCSSTGAPLRSWAMIPLPCSKSHLPAKRMAAAVARQCL